MSKKHNRYTKEQLISILKEIGNKKGRQPSQLDLIKGVHPTVNTFVRIFGSWHDALSESGFNQSKYKRLKYTRDELSNYLVQFKKEYSTIPTTELLDKDPKYPNSYYFIKEFGSFQNALVENNLIQERDKKKKYTKSELIDFLHKYFEKYKKPPTTKGLEEDRDFPSYRTYLKVFGSFENALIESGYYNMREDKYYFKKKIYTDDELLGILDEFIKSNNGIIPTAADIDKIESMPSSVTYRARFGGFTNAIKLLGYTPTIEKPISKSTEEMISDLKKLFSELGRVPSKKDIDGCEYCASYAAYYSRFKGYYNMLNAAKIPYKKSGKMLADEEIIETWYKIVQETGRYPTRKTLKEYKINSQIMIRWGNYYNFLKDIGIPINKDTYGFRIYYTKNGTKCFSEYELDITQWLEDHKIDFDKEVKYRDVIPTDDTHRRFDWVIKKNGKIYYVEMFGIHNNKKYDLKIENKIKTCKESKINLIAIYPNDLKNKSLDEIFSFLK